MKRFNRVTQSGTLTHTTVELGIHQRIRSRQRITLSTGEEALMDIERGITLRDGDQLASEAGEVVTVVSAPETVSVVRTDDLHLLARVCYHLGNRHVPLQITPAWVSYLHDHVLDAMVVGLGAEVATEHAHFEPENGAYGGQSHSHSHSHSH